MVKLLAREAALVLLTALFGALAIPALLGQPAALELFWAGLLMALTFMALYAMLLLAGNKMPAKVRDWLGVLSWAGMFVGDFAWLLSLLRAGAVLTPGALYTVVAPGGFSLVLIGLAVWRAPAPERRESALATLYAYSLGMLGVRTLLVPMVGSNHVATFMAAQAGAFYLALRVLVRIYWPGTVEGDGAAPPLIDRPVPDAIVGLVESVSRRRARPYATGRGGGAVEGVISVLARPDEVEGLVARITKALDDRPFAVAQGAPVDGHVEIIIKPQERQAESQVT